MQGAFISASPRLCGKIVSQIFAHIFPAIHPASIQSIRAQAAALNLPHLTSDRRRTKSFPDVDFEFVD